MIDDRRVCRQHKEVNKKRSRSETRVYIIPKLTLLELQSRLGDKPLKFQVVCLQLSRKRDCSPKRVIFFFLLEELIIQVSSALNPRPLTKSEGEILRWKFRSGHIEGDIFKGTPDVTLFSPYTQQKRHAILKTNCCKQPSDCVFPLLAA